MVSNSTTLDLINVISQVPDLKQVYSDLGAALPLKIKIPTLIIIPNKTQNKRGVIPNPVFRQKQKEWQERNLKREHKIEKYLHETDNYQHDNKEIIKDCIKKTDAFYKLEAYLKFVDTIQERCTKQIDDLWYHDTDQEENSVFWSKKDDINFHEADKRNKAETIRNHYDESRKKYRFIKLIRVGSYENKGAWVYKNKKAYTEFLKEAKRECPVKKAEKKKSTIEIISWKYDEQYDSNRYQEDEL